MQAVIHLVKRYTIGKLREIYTSQQNAKGKT